jgi:hypothetical protein
VVSLTSSSGGYINGRNSANLELLIDKTSSIYLYVKLKALASIVRCMSMSETAVYILTIMGRRGRERMAVGFTTTCAISAYHH